jgi:hypothetical protein
LASFTGIASTAATIATPIGWSIAITVGITAATYGLICLVRDGGTQDERRKQIANALRQRIAELQKETIPQQKIELIINTVNELMAKKIWEQEKGQQFIASIKDGSLSIQFAEIVLNNFLTELDNPPKNNETAEEYEKRMTAAHVFTTLKKSIHSSENNQADEAYFAEMAEKYNISREQASVIYQQAPVGDNINELVNDFSNVFNNSVLNEALMSLRQTAEGMAKGQDAYYRYLELERLMQTQLNQQLTNLNQAGLTMKSAIDRL